METWRDARKNTSAYKLEMKINASQQKLKHPFSTD